MDLNWTVDYGHGPKRVELPHTWHGDKPVTWTGPAIYRTRFRVPLGSPCLLFEGVSCDAAIKVNGKEVLSHRGIWDAFTLDLTPWQSQEVELEVSVIKPGGSSLPINSTAGGFLPFVFNTFGGIYRPVRLLDHQPGLEPPAPAYRVKVEADRILANDKPFFMKGVLTWGWYPRTASPNPSLAVIQDELDKIVAMGFNTVKLCLWVPPHAYLEEMAKRGLWAWMELPLWQPSTDPKTLDRLADELMRVVRQYRHHPNIIAWTAGCELGDGIDPAFRQRLVTSIGEVTGHPLIKDNSGGAEMYGGSPQEFGSFNDFHPYCDSPFYPQVIDSLRPGPREPMPTLLGEFNDYDVVRPVQTWASDPPYWASPDPDLNAQGVRWQYDLPGIMEKCRRTDLGKWLEARWPELKRSSLSQGDWMRRRAFDCVRLAGFSGWVLTGHRDTPISSSGVVDDDGDIVYPAEVVKTWNAETSLILFPRRTPPWVNGGNRPGWEPTRVRFAGPSLFQVAVHSDHATECSLQWKLEPVDVPNGTGLRGGGQIPLSVPALTTMEVGKFAVDLSPGLWRLTLIWGGIEQSFPIRVSPKDSKLDRSFLVPDPALISRPYFRECCWSWESPLWAEASWVDDWDRFELVANDGVLDPAWLDQHLPGWKPLLVRLDTRTFERLPAVALANGQIACALRPDGGLGDAPLQASRNPAGQDLLRLLKQMAQA